MELLSFVRRALSVPFVIGGRDWDGWDCWGLVYVAHRDLFGNPIARLDHEYNSDVSFSELNEVVSVQRASDWNEVSKPVLGDVALFSVGRFRSHVALVCERGQMLHSTTATGTVIERLDTVTWARRHVGYFRHRNRAA